MYGGPYTQPNPPLNDITNQQNELKLLESNAKQGDAEAQYQLGYHHQFGIGIPRSILAAQRWYELAVANGCTAAQLNLWNISREVEEKNIQGEENIPPGGYVPLDHRYIGFAERF